MNKAKSTPADTGTAENAIERTPAVKPVTETPEFAAAVDAAVQAYLDSNLARLVEEALPPSPEQQQQRARDSYEETVRKQQAANARKAKREAKEQAKSEAAAAADRAKREEAAAKAFAAAAPFIGEVGDITAKIVRGIKIDDGRTYSADYFAGVRASELEATTDGGLLLTKAIELPARGREFPVKGVSLVTDAGVLRIALNGARKCGGGKAVRFPERSLLFRPAPAGAAPDDA